MAARTSKTKNAIITVAVILLIFLAVGLFMRAFGGFDKLTTLSVQMGNAVIKDEAADMVVTPTTEFKVKTIRKDYTVTVFASDAEKDFTFTADGKTYSWNENVSGQDMDTAFEVAKDGKTFVLKFDTVQKTLETLYSSPVTVDESATEQPLFMLTIVSGSKTVNIGFKVKVPTSISLPEQIIFS